MPVADFLKIPHFAGLSNCPYTPAMPFEIRDISAADLEAVLAMNEAAVPAVNSIDIDQMTWFLNHAAYFRGAADGADLGAFMIGLREGIDYGSLNYRWFCERYEQFAYVDRIAVSEHARRNGLASTLYRDFAASLPAEIPVLLCEVNLRPANEVSMRFHQNSGFRQVGSQTTENGSKEVALLEKRLAIDEDAESRA